MSDETTEQSSEEIAQRVYELLGHEINLSSPQQIATALVNDLKLPLVKRSRRGAKVDSETLAELQQSDPHEVVDLLLRWRKARAAERRESTAGARPGLKDEIDYEEIAEIMGVKVQTVRVYAVRDPDFPPVVAAIGRTPLRSRKALKRYLKLREARQGPQGGRPPRPARGME